MKTELRVRSCPREVLEGYVDVEVRGASPATKEVSPDVDTWSIGSSGLSDLATAAGGDGVVGSVAPM